VVRVHPSAPAAPWRKGYAPDCKSGHAGSNPVGASHPSSEPSDGPIAPHIVPANGPADLQIRPQSAKEHRENGKDGYQEARARSGLQQTARVEERHRSGTAIRTIRRKLFSPLGGPKLPKLPGAARTIFQGSLTSWIEWSARCHGIRWRASIRRAVGRMAAPLRCLLATRWRTTTKRASVRHAGRRRGDGRSGAGARHEPVALFTGTPRVPRRRVKARSGAKRGREGWKSRSALRPRTSG
jgi:hypothetical protein